MIGYLCGQKGWNRASKFLLQNRMREMRHPVFVPAIDQHNINPVLGTRPFRRGRMY